jgi:hypothetical protein
VWYGVEVCIKKQQGVLNRELEKPNIILQCDEGISYVSSSVVDTLQLLINKNFSLSYTLSLISYYS